MPDNVVVVPHPPALKVGGRRRSVSNKHKPHSSNAGGQLTEPVGSGETENDEAVPDDYPRPAPPGEGQGHPHEAHHNQHDDEQPRREKKHSSNEKLKEYTLWKAETTRPTRDGQSNVMKAWGAGGRIAQPVGKGFGL